MIRDTNSYTSKPNTWKKIFTHTINLRNQRTESILLISITDKNLNTVKEPSKNSISFAISERLNQCIPVFEVNKAFCN